MKIAIVTIFPEMFDTLGFGVIGKALLNKHVDIRFYNPRDFTADRHRRVDDKPYGGGPGMVMKVEPIRNAVKAAKKDLKIEAKTIYVSPQGQRLDQPYVNKLASRPGLIFIAGRYEGIDERVIQYDVDEEISIGDYVLTGGELPIMVVLDALIRRLPNVLGDEQSAEQDSFSEGLLDYPHYTRPESIDGQKVPDILLNGNHLAIEDWRKKQSILQTLKKRPDLIKKKSQADFTNVNEIVPDSNDD